MADTASPLATVAPAAHPVGEIISLGTPLLIAALFSSTAGVIDTVMMGHYGTAQLAAVSGASAIFDLFSSLVLAALIGHQILASRFAGAGDQNGVQVSLRASVRFCGAIALALTVLCWVAGGWLTGLVVGPDPQLHHLGAQYLATRAPTILLLVPFGLLASTFNAHRRTGFALRAGITVGVLNLVLDLLLIFGFGPLPRWAVAGNGLATTLSVLVGVLYLGIAGWRGGFSWLSLPPAPVRAPVAFPTSIPRLAVPAIISTALDYASTLVFFAILGTAGAAELAGGRIGFEILVLAFGLGSSFAVGGRILIGRALGAGQTGRVRELWRLNQRILLAPAALVTLLLIGRPGWVAEAFSSSTAVVAQATKVLPIVGLCTPLIAWSLGNVNQLRALGRVKQEMWSNLIAAVVVQLPLAYVFTMVSHGGARGAYLGVLGYWCSRAVFTEVLAHRAVPRDQIPALEPTTGR
jgi:putative MATE family efflux protein